MKKDDCIFCKIANGEIPSDTVYEDEYFRGILDLSPASKGHTLIIPKEHYNDITDIPEEVLDGAMRAAQKTGRAVIQAMDACGLNIVQNTGEAAGQTVMHFHIHLIPRYKGDGRMVAWQQHESKKEEQAEIAGKIKKLL